MKGRREGSKGGKRGLLKGREIWFSYSNQSTMQLWKETKKLSSKRKRSFRMMSITGKWNFKIRNRKF